MENLVTIDSLTKVYDNRNIAVNNISLTIPKGKIIGLLGPNGSGKTTLIKMINGLLCPNHGSIRILDHEPGPETKKHIAYLPDRTYLENSKKIYE